MRCQFSTKDFYDKRIEFEEESCEKERCFGIFNKHLKKKNRVNTSVLYNSYFMRKLVQVAYRYGRGDELNSIQQLVIGPSLDRFEIAFDTLAEHMNTDEYFLHGEHVDWYDARTIYSRDIIEIYAIICWYLAFGATEDPRFIRLLNRLSPESISLPIDSVLSRFLPERDINSNNPRIKDSEFLRRWEAFFELPNENSAREAFLEEYLEDWSRLLTTELKDGETFYSFAVQIGRIIHTSNDTLQQEYDRGIVEFPGFWAWEVALMVMLYGLDDSSFRDHILYPVDLVDYYRSTPV